MDWHTTRINEDGDTAYSVTAVQLLLYSQGLLSSEKPLVQL